LHKNTENKKNKKLWELVAGKMMNMLQICSFYETNYWLDCDLDGDDNDCDKKESRKDRLECSLDLLFIVQDPD